jgi:CubicO group peptidase (beta-lactamase class C family)
MFGMMRLVERGALDLDADVNDRLTMWTVPPTGAGSRASRFAIWPATPPA